MKRDRITCLAVLIMLPLFWGAIIAEPVAVQHAYTGSKDVEWAKPGGQSLTMDIYTPQTGKASYPVLIIYHGGAWMINNKSVMDSMSIYIVQKSEYVVCNVNYRLFVDAGNTITLNQIVEDVLGAVAWVQANIAAYKGAPDKLIVTGDSAGGHLAAMVVLAGDKLESDGFAGASLGFCPTWLPPGVMAEQVAQKSGLAVQAAILSYPALDLHAACVGGFEKTGNYFWNFAKAQARGIFGDSITVETHADFYKMVSPVYLLPDSSQKKLPPQLCMVGSADNLIPPASVREYVVKLNALGQPAEYWEHEGRPHAYLDAWKNDYLGISFGKDAPLALDRMIEFMDRIFY